MSRTVLCVLTAAVMTVLSISVMIVRSHVMGTEVKRPNAGDWKVALVVKGKGKENVKIATATPLDFHRQHIHDWVFSSKELIDNPPSLRHPDRHQVIWIRRPGVTDSVVHARYEFYCRMDVGKPTSSMSELASTLNAPPPPDKYLGSTSRNGADEEEIANLAHRLTEGMELPADQAQALYHYVAFTISKEPSLKGAGMTAAECVKNGSGNSRGKSRLLVELLRSCRIPARFVTGLALTKGKEQLEHHWVEAWLDNRWLPMCPFYQHYLQVPSTYLIFTFDDAPIVRGWHVDDLDYAFLVERVSRHEEAPVPDPSPLHHFFSSVSLSMLPPMEESMVKLLLVFPVAALIICVCRNIVGVNSFGTFAPALLGLAFRDEQSMQRGIGVFAWNSFPGILLFAGIILVGWGMRRVLEYYRILQVPRTAFMLSLIVCVLITAVVLANHFQHMPSTALHRAFPIGDSHGHGRTFLDVGGGRRHSHVVQDLVVHGGHRHEYCTGCQYPFTGQSPVSFSGNSGHCHGGPIASRPLHRFSSERIIPLPRFSESAGGLAAPEVKKVMSVQSCAGEPVTCHACKRSVGMNQTHIKGA